MEAGIGWRSRSEGRGRFRSAPSAAGRKGERSTAFSPQLNADVRCLQIESMAVMAVCCIAMLIALKRGRRRKDDGGKEEWCLRVVVVAWARIFAFRNEMKRTRALPDSEP